MTFVGSRVALLCFLVEDVIVVDDGGEVPPVGAGPFAPTVVFDPPSEAETLDPPLGFGDSDPPLVLISGEIECLSMHSIWW